ncbi:hypothetical protein CROQUDRAFT_131107 [Cronartium quercuum f. sp. fusiforme G11]|uniref:Uncharacterized protein n=1 Tax=Cronartium quercuum f. sp. fusiforme G11 TaxID=708437 RepID=A0A9P6TGF5_9BASI|nr:hypothetical protein CROQUDRAFT_131107 [Cronartium quercuum f. sp. fusiforme G11]
MSSLKYISNPTSSSVDSHSVSRSPSPQQEDLQAMFPSSSSNNTIVNHRMNRDEIQKALDEERALVIKFSPLPYATSLDVLNALAQSLSDPPYRLPTPNWVDSAQGTTAFFGYLYDDQSNDHNLLRTLLPAIVQHLNKCEVNLLDIDQIRAMGLQPINSLAVPLRWSICLVGYLPGSVLGLVNPWSNKELTFKQEKMSKKCKSLNSGQDLIRGTCCIKRSRRDDQVKNLKENYQKIEKTLKFENGKEKLANTAKLMLQARQNRPSPQEKWTDNAKKYQLRSGVRHTTE